MTDDEVMENEENGFKSLWSIECFQISPADAETSIRLICFLQISTAKVRIITTLKFEGDEFWKV